MKYKVEVRWSVRRVYNIEAESKGEAEEKMRDLVNSGEVCVWTDGFEASDGDGEPRISVKETE